jgi:hypothetical protein
VARLAEPEGPDRIIRPRPFRQIPALHCPANRRLALGRAGPTQFCLLRHFSQAWDKPIEFSWSTSGTARLFFARLSFIPNKPPPPLHHLLPPPQLALVVRLLLLQQSLSSPAPTAIMFMASRIQSRAFSASARQVSLLPLRHRHRPYDASKHSLDLHLPV